MDANQEIAMFEKQIKRRINLETARSNANPHMRVVNIKVALPILLHEQVPNLELTIVVAGSEGHLQCFGFAQQDWSTQHQP